MNPHMQTARHAIIGAAAFGLALAMSVPAQTNPQFTSVSATDEGAIRLAWASQSNEVYEIDEADALGTNANGSTAWNLLYEDYPSQGANTFWLDTGNYTFVPIIPHPKYAPMRFYRIVDKGPDTASDEPSAAIISPGTNAVVSGELTIMVVASTDQPFLAGTQLYVDGQAMKMADSTTNYSNGSINYELDTYTINTCEWGNGTHILFATVMCQSANAVTINAPPVCTGHGVSAFIPVTFNNLVTRISFSQPSFDPSSGQIQQVSAIFVSNSDWTLNIVDINSNLVLAATGSGGSMSYNWDGTGKSGTNLPNGIYYYYITAQTNGLALPPNISSTNNGGGSPPSPGFTMSSSLAGPDAIELWAMPADGSGAAVPLILYPPGFDTNELLIFSASFSQMMLQSESASTFTANEGASGGDSPDGAGSGAPAPPSAQSTPPAPQRPPNNPVRGLQGTFGVGCDSYTANGTNGITLGPLLDGSGLGTHIQFEGHGGTAYLNYEAMALSKFGASAFASQMQGWGWTNAIYKVDDQLSINDLTGSGSPFNNVNLVLLLLHGTYGTSIDYAANGCKQMYFPITSGGGGQYLRMSQMNFGGSGANGLKWIGIYACYSLYHVNWSSMKNAGVKPYNSNLHLLLGSDAACYPSLTFGTYWAKYMNYGTSTNAASPNPLTIRAAWYQAARDAYKMYKVSLPDGASSAVMAVAGDAACMDDTLQTNYSPMGNWTYDNNPVWP